jgi:hypothetical protein
MDDIACDKQLDLFSSQEEPPEEIQTTTTGTFFIIIYNFIKYNFHPNQGQWLH